MLEQLKISHRLAILFSVVAVGLIITNAYSIYSLRASLLDARQGRLRMLVETSAGVLEHFHDQQQSGELSEEAAKEAALATIQKLRYDKKEYFWINDLDARVVMHPIKPELNGKNAVGMKDPNGKAIFSEFARIARTQGAGFVDYMWPKPGHDEPIPKVSYVRLFQPWGWVIGSGVYLDDDDVAVVTRQESISLLIFGAVLLIVLSLASWIISSSILHQLGGELTYSVTAIGRIAAGELNHGLIIQGRTSSLLGAVGNMREKLTGVVLRVNSLSQALLIQAETVASTSNQLGAASHSQADATSQSAAAIEELTASITEVSETAKHTETNSCQTVVLAEEGNALIKDIAKEIQAVSHTVTTSSEQIRSLDQRAREIGGIADVIKEIADQTNLLALNAAIEAARAGEHGRGFAVVSDEVRKLAERTTLATLEIGTMIAAIQDDTLAAVVAMQLAVPQVQKGLDLTEQATLRLNEIHGQANDSLDKVRDVAQATMQQTSAATNIALNVQNIAAMAEQNNAAMKLNAESASALESMAEELRLAIDYFQAA
jgi:methyl-accepting chemotaxis protein